LKNFLAGFLTTLANPKAIVFYVSFFPSFINLGNLRLYDVLMSLIVVTLAVGGVMVSYAHLAGKVSYLFQSATTQRKLNQIAGCILLATGGWLIAKMQLW
jgi:threonine/homoserine/homoserine lactone efflux protein